MQKKLKKAFTMIELLIVIVILGLLSSIIIPNVMNKGEEAKANIVCIQMKSIGESIKMFKIDNGNYPTTKEGLSILIQNDNEEKYPNYSSSGYLDGKLPKDPWKRNYIYIADKNSFEILSLGADGEEDGEDVNKDIKYSTCNN